MKVVNYESATMKVTMGVGKAISFYSKGGFCILRRLCEPKAIGIATMKVGIGPWARGGRGSCRSAETMKVGNYESGNYESDILLWAGGEGWQGPAKTTLPEFHSCQRNSMDGSPNQGYA